MNVPHPRAFRTTLKVGNQEASVWAVVSEVTSIVQRKAIEGRLWLVGQHLRINLEDTVDLVLPDGSVEAVCIVGLHLDVSTLPDGDQRLEARFRSERNMRK